MSRKFDFATLSREKLLKLGVEEDPRAARFAEILAPFVKGVDARTIASGFSGWAMNKGYSREIVQVSIEVAAEAEGVNPTPLQTEAVSTHGRHGRGQAVAGKSRLPPDLLHQLESSVIKSAPSKPSKSPRKQEGSEPPFEEIEPCHEPVSGPELLDAIRSELERFVKMPLHAAVAVALWIVRSWAFDSFTINPRLAIVSPVKGCGKTRLLEVLQQLLPRPLMVSNISPAALFRAIEAWTPSLLIDELDAYGDEMREELRGIINSGHTRSGAHVLRVAESGSGRREPRTYSTWAPMALAKIGALPETIAHRSITASMQRKMPGEPVDRWTVTGRRGKAIRARLMELARKAKRWAADSAEALSDADPDIPDEITDDRARDNWTPLLAVADLAGGIWPASARAAGIGLSGSAPAVEQELGVELLRDLRDIFDGLGADSLSSADLCIRLEALEGRPWADSGRRGGPINQRGLAKLLSMFGIISRTVRPQEGGTPKGYRRGQLEDAWSRYLSDAPPSATATAPQMPENESNGAKTENHETPRPLAVADRTFAPGAAPDGQQPVCGGVADGDGALVESSEDPEDVQF
jgi:hypothetical protein